MSTPEETGRSRCVSFDSTSCFLWILNHQGEILDVNPYLVETLGYPKDELIGKSLISLYPDTHQKNIHEQLKVLRNQNFIFYNSPIVAVTGVMIPVETVMIKGFWNSKPAFLGYFRNITGQPDSDGDTPFFFSGSTLEPGQKNYLDMAALSIKELEATRKELISCKEKIIQLTDEYSVKGDREIRERKYIEKEISKKNILLAEKNITLKQLLDQREKEKQEIRDEIYKKVQSLILPLIGRIQTNGTEADKRYLQAVLHNLQEIISPLSSETAKKMSILSSRELEICNLILQGCNSKDIAEMLCLSIQTVNTHRKNMRKKLKLTASGLNLAAYIKSEDTLKNW
ncbi:MAG: hypothetical protein A2277_13425 [Desulfobacterales bacterium RIFOXYA12_FULL_46_15]|nr:MAG: hypothetical protein A2277_13425 [Desulfobacterales bacterium RIFOXYA12_FULL_46_15]